MAENLQTGTAFVATGSVTGAWVSTSVGGIGLVGGFGGIGLGIAPVTAAGAVFGAATYGAFQAISEGDKSAFGAIGIGSLGGIGISAAVGGMGLSFSGTAVGIGMGSMAVAGGVFGLGIYGLIKSCSQAPGERMIGAIDAFERMEETVIFQEAYTQALLELEIAALEKTLLGDPLDQKFAALEMEGELQALKAQMVTGDNSFNAIEKELQALKELLKKPISPIQRANYVFSSQTFKSSLNNENIDPPVSEFSNDTEENILPVKSVETQTWKCAKILKGHTGSVNAIALIPNSEIIASASADKTVSLWNLKTGKIIYTFYGQSQEVSTVAISPNGKIIASGSFDQKVTTWKLDTKVLLSTCFDLNLPYSHKGFVYSIAFSTDNQFLVSGSADKTIKIWNPNTGKLIRTLKDHSAPVLSLAITSNNQVLVSGSADKTIKLWSFPDGKQINTLTGHSGWVTTVAISTDGNTFVSGSADSTIKLWNLQTGELIHTLTGHSQAVFSIAISPDGKTIVSGSINEVKLWNLHTGELLDNISGCSPVIFSNDCKILTGGERNTIKVWHLCFDVDAQPDFVQSGEWWEVLGVDKLAHYNDVKQAYRQLGRQYHPDVNRSENAKTAMQTINQAYQEFCQLQRFGIQP